MLVADVLAALSVCAAAFLLSPPPSVLASWCTSVWPREKKKSTENTFIFSSRPTRGPSLTQRLCDVMLETVGTQNICRQLDRSGVGSHAQGLLHHIPRHALEFLLIQLLRQLVAPLDNARKLGRSKLLRLGERCTSLVLVLKLPFPVGKVVVQPVLCDAGGRAALGASQVDDGHRETCWRIRDRRDVRRLRLRGPSCPGSSGPPR